MDNKNLLNILKQRFFHNMHRHPNLNWDDISLIFEKDPALYQSVLWMEETGGEPDITYLNGICVYVDFSKESPIGRRSLCYDEKALEKRKRNKPSGSIESLLTHSQTNLLNEKQYRLLQEIEPLDLKTSSWIHTPERIRNLGGALFCERRYDTCFVFHNGADAYYASRGFRVYLPINL